MLKGVLVSNVEANAKPTHAANEISGMTAIQTLMQAETVAGSVACNLSNPQYLRKMQASVENLDEAFLREQRLDKSGYGKSFVEDVLCVWKVASWWRHLRDALLLSLNPRRLYDSMSAPVTRSSQIYTKVEEVSLRIESYDNLTDEFAIYSMDQRTVELSAMREKEKSDSRNCACGPEDVRLIQQVHMPYCIVEPRIRSQGLPSI